jgi:translation initiation factor 2 alpha subunit (eIF-2alpha)
MRSATNINDVEKSVKANNLSFVNQNAKEAFVKIEKTEDLTNLHARGVDSAKKVLRLIANNI